MLIKNGIIFIWSGTHASIPSGWSRVTAMDDKYPKGTADATNPNTTGGAATHTHTSVATHTHTNAAHTHTITIANTTSTGTAAGSGGQPSIHNHTCPASGAVTSFSASSPSATYASASNDPEYHKIIFVTPTTGVTKLPSGIITLADSAVPAGFNVCDGNNGTPNLVDKFLKGASAGADAGATGGSKQNTHALSHTHTTSHAHSAVTSGTPSLNNIAVSGSGTIPASNHTHSIALPAATPSTADDVSLVTTETNIEPAYTKLMAMKASAETPAIYNIIAMWIGTLTNIPRGWVLCDGNGGTVDMRDRHLKITATLGEVGNTGGSNTHTHAAQTHNHSVAHTHSTTASHVSSGITVTSGGSNTKGETSHAVSTNSQNLVLNSASTSANSSNNEPPYRTVAFIKLVSMSSGNTFLMNFIH